MSNVVTYFVGLYINDKFNKFDIITDMEGNVPCIDGILEDIQIVSKLANITGFCCKAFTKSFIYYADEEDTLILIVGFKTAFINEKKFTLKNYVDVFSQERYAKIKNEVHNVLV